MPSLPITNVVTISVSSPPAGVADYKVNNLAIFSKETPVNVLITASNPGVYKTPTDVATDWGSGSEVYAQANLIFSQTPNILNGGGELIVFPMQSGDTLATNIPIAVAVAPFFGILYAGYAPNDAEVIAAAAVTEPLRIKLFASSHLTSSTTPSTGLIAILTASNYKHARGLLYTVGALALNARKMAAAYAGRAMSVNFEGNATTSTMHLKDLVGIVGDPNITQAVLNTAQTAGADVYAIIAGAPKVYSSGANDFWDNVYNTDWLVFSLQVAGFNALATTSTKLPQTEPGIAVLRGAYINVLNLAVRNSFLAPGAWNSSELFGNPADLIRNVAQLGFYIYSTPVNQQSQASRVARQAPLIQIAVKFAGAVHSTSVVVSVNP
jgi:hypothetical protein